MHLKFILMMAVFIFSNFAFGQAPLNIRPSFHLPLDSTLTEQFRTFYDSNPEQVVFKVEKFKNFPKVFKDVDFLGHCSYALGAPVCYSFIAFENGRIAPLTISLLDSIFLANALFSSNKKSPEKLMAAYIFLSDGGKVISSIHDVKSLSNEDFLKYENVIHNVTIPSSKTANEQKMILYSYQRKNRTIYRYEFGFAFDYIWLHGPKRTIIASEIGPPNHFK